MTNRTFIFYPEWREAAQRFAEPEDRAEFMQAVVDYGVTGECDIKSDMVRMVFETTVRSKIDVAQAKY